MAVKWNGSEGKAVKKNGQSYAVYVLDIYNLKLHHVTILQKMITNCSDGDICEEHDLMLEKELNNMWKGSCATPVYPTGEHHLSQGKNTWCPLVWQRHQIYVGNEGLDLWSNNFCESAGQTSKKDSDSVMHTHRVLHSLEGKQKTSLVLCTGWKPWHLSLKSIWMVKKPQSINT